MGSSSVLIARTVFGWPGPKTYWIKRTTKLLQLQTFYMSSNLPQVFLHKDVLKICSKFTPIPKRNFKSNFILWHGCSHVNVLDIFKSPFSVHLSTVPRYPKPDLLIRNFWFSKRLRYRCSNFKTKHQNKVQNFLKVHNKDVRTTFISDV